MVTPTGLSTTSVQSLQISNQNHPVTQSQRLVEPTNTYGLPPISANTYGPPASTDTIETLELLNSVTYGPPTDSYGTPPVKLTSAVTETSALSRFAASQPFTPRPTYDQSRLESNTIEQNSNVDTVVHGIVYASESTQPPQTPHDEQRPILQVLQELNVTTTPEGFHVVSTEPSPTTPNPPSYGAKRTDVSKTSIRGTPIDLLDTPNSLFRRTNESRTPEFKFMQNTWKPLRPNPFSNPVSVVTTLAPKASSPVTPSAASSAFQQNHLNEPTPATQELDDNGQKKKKIQIIIPYTAKNSPSPFRNQAQYQSFESADGWSQSDSHDDFHNSEESQLISAATPTSLTLASLKRNESNFAKFLLAKNIRELLKREHLKNISSINLARLQKNIDGWTEQEWSMSPNRASTISLLAQPKHIPSEYLTTTQSIRDMLDADTITPTTEYPSTIFDWLNGSTDQQEPAGEEINVNDNHNDNDNEIRQSFDISSIADMDDTDDSDDIEPEEQKEIQQAEKILDDDFKRLDYLKSLENTNRILEAEQNIFYATNPPPPSTASTTTTTTTTTTPLPPCSMTTTTESSVRTTVLPSAEELWNRIKSLLSPVTSDAEEKVYVVTPQPYPYPFESEKRIDENDDENIIANFKSPRFSVRPTPFSIGEGRASNSIARLSFRPRCKFFVHFTFPATISCIPFDSAENSINFFSFDTFHADNQWADCRQQR